MATGSPDASWWRAVSVHTRRCHDSQLLMVIVTDWSERADRAWPPLVSVTCKSIVCRCRCWCRECHRVPHSNARRVTADRCQSPAAAGEVAESFSCAVSCWPPSRSATWWWNARCSARDMSVSVRSVLVEGPQGPRRKGPYTYASAPRALYNNIKLKKKPSWSVLCTAV